MCVIRPAQGPAFVAALPVKRFHGVGPVTAAKMAALGIVTGADLRDFGLDALTRQFGSSAGYFHRAAHGDDDRPVRPDRPPKSVGAERTFDRDLTDEAELLAALEPVIDAAWRRIERAGAAGRTLTLKVKFADFTHHQPGADPRDADRQPRRRRRDRAGDPAAAAAGAMPASGCSD